MTIKRKMTSTDSDSKMVCNICCEEVQPNDVAVSLSCHQTIWCKTCVKKYVENLTIRKYNFQIPFYMQCSSKCKKETVYIWDALTPRYYFKYLETCVDYMIDNSTFMECFVYKKLKQCYKPPNDWKEFVEYVFYRSTRSEYRYVTRCQECDNGIIMKESNGFLECSQCEKKICQECWHYHLPETECDETAKSNVFQILSDRSRPCPQCFIYIVRTEGCNEVFCQYCKTHIDYDMSGKADPCIFVPQVDFIRFNVDPIHCFKSSNVYDQKLYANWLDIVENKTLYPLINLKYLVLIVHEHKLAYYFKMLNKNQLRQNVLKAYKTYFYNYAIMKAYMDFYANMKPDYGAAAHNEQLFNKKLRRLHRIFDLKVPKISGGVSISFAFLFTQCLRNYASLTKYDYIYSPIFLGKYSLELNNNAYPFDYHRNFLFN
jgi:hypothetical protein